MAYCIQYNQGIAKRTQIRDTVDVRKGRVKMVFLLLLIVFLFVSAYMGWSADFLIPGNREITKAAFAEMVQDVEDGESIKTAIAEFCREVISGADAAQGSDIH